MNTLNSHFDKIYCINLDEATERWDGCLEQFEKYNITVERFSAIKPLEGKNGLLKGELGCLLSNLEVVKDAYKNNYEKIFILEDDFQFVDNFDILFDEYSKQLPLDWDMFYFGGNHTKGFQMVNTNIAKTIHTYTTHSFGLKNSIFEHIIELLPSAKKPVDVYYAELQSIFNSYVTRPHLSYQKEGYSYIQGGDVNYDFLK